MSIQETRGGIPHIFRGAIPATDGRYHRFPQTSKYLMIETGLTQVKLYFTAEDFANDANYIGPVNEWEGPVESRGVWIMGDGALAAEVRLVAFLRRS